MKKSQSSMEFILLLFFMVSVFAGFFIITQSKIVEVVDKKDTEYLKEVNSIVLMEVSLAARSFSDYYSFFTIPSQIQGKNFDIYLQDEQEVIINYSNKSYVNFLNTPVKGQLKLGLNKILYLDGKFKFKGNDIYNETYSGVFINVNPEMCYIYNNTNFTGITLCEYYANMETNPAEHCHLFDLCV